MVPIHQINVRRGGRHAGQVRQVHLHGEARPGMLAAVLRCQAIRNGELNILKPIKLE